MVVSTCSYSFNYFNLPLIDPINSVPFPAISRMTSPGAPPLEGIRSSNLPASLQGTLAPSLLSSLVSSDPYANPHSPFAGLLLAGYGASVLRIDRSSHAAANPRTKDLLTRHKSSFSIDLRSPSSFQLLENLLREGKIDVLIDPFRPGVLEKFGLGPEVCLQLNPRLIYACITECNWRFCGWRGNACDGDTSCFVGSE
ncbi:CoA-transferase family III domain-containing protein [Terfezia claveryi]|nr:CoA-transferase family III domain-containing protein [Terfezia claveryi]